MAVLGSDKEPVYFAYVKIQQASTKYESKETEWTVDCIVSEKVAKAWKKKFKKQPPKEHDNAEFKKIFKIEPPFPDQEEQFVIKLKKDTHYKERDSGKLKPLDAKYRPRVLLKTDLKTKEGKPVLKDITFDTLISNGSTGVAQYDVVDNTFGSFAKLKAIRIDDLIEYVQDGGFDELGEVDDLAEGSIEEDFEESEDVDDEAPFDIDEDDEREY